MEWNLEEALSYYKRLGAPRDQNALIGLLREIQQEHGNSIPDFLPKLIAEAYAVKESYILAIIKRIPSLRIDQQHLMEVCSGPNCGKHTELIAYIEKLQKQFQQHHASPPFRRYTARLTVPATSIKAMEESFKLRKFTARIAANA